MYAVGTMLSDQYRIEAHLGEGGTGSVYLARDLKADELVAIKQIKFSGTSAEMQTVALQTFQNEANVLRQLDHPSLPKVHRCFAVGTQPFLVMDYLKGRNLASVVASEEEPLPETMVRQWAAELCTVLEYLHEHDPPIVFRDLKPANIILDVEGRICLVDFGVSKLFDKHGPVYTKTYAKGCGTPGFAAPEQYSGGTGVRTDIYSLGATLYFLLSGKIPATAVERVGQISALVALPKLRPEVTPQFADGIEKLMAIKAAERPRSIASVRSLLGLDKEEPLPPPPPPEPLPPPYQSPRFEEPKPMPSGRPAGVPFPVPVRETPPEPLPTPARAASPMRPMSVPPPTPAPPPPPPPAPMPPTRNPSGQLAWGNSPPSSTSSAPATRPRQGSAAASRRGMLWVLVALMVAAVSVFGYVAMHPTAAVGDGGASELIIRTQPRGANVTINGEHRGVTPLALELLKRGAYAVVIHRDGFRDVQRNLILEDGESDHLDLLLFPIPVSASPTSIEPESPPSPAASVR